MKPDLVADVGNTRIKWGRCLNDQVKACRPLDSNDATNWQRQIEEEFHRDKQAGGQTTIWAIGGVHPARRDRLYALVEKRGEKVLRLDDWRQLPLRVQVEHPEKAGIDRLFNAVAANSRRKPGTPAIVADAGSAVTVDWIDESGSFRGGAIFPGLSFMARALHDYTALLPLVEEWLDSPALPGTATMPAIQAGVFWAVAGGIQALTEQLGKQAAGTVIELFLTGGDAAIVAKALDRKPTVWPEMTLEGIRISALAMS